MRLTGPEIAETLEMATSTVSAVLKRIGLGKLSRLVPEEPVRRYEKSRPGELIHIDVKKLGRIVGGAGHRIVGRQGQRRNLARLDASGIARKSVGWECVHGCVRDAARLAYVEVLPDEKAKTAIGFLRRALALYRSNGIVVERLMTDHQRQGERFIRTMLREWTYAAVYGSSPERAAVLSGWIERYNFRRRHGALGHRPPTARLPELNGNNVTGIYT